jgi:hypothetical protein
MKKKILFGIMIVLLLLGTVACAGAASGPNDEGRGEYTYTVSATTTATSYQTKTPAPTTITQSSFGGNSDYALPDTNTRMVIYNAYLTLVVDDVSASLKKITDLAAGYGGFVVNSNISEDKNTLYASISFRVLSSRFNDTVQALHNLSVNVKSETTSGQDVTEDYTDLASKLRNLEASETQLLELMKQAGKVEEILAVQRELVSTREEIEVIKGRMQYLEESSNLALFTVSLEQSKLIVEFSADTRTVREGETLAFNPSVVGGFYPYTYEWNFGDDETSTEVNPTHVYSSGGTYTVKLKVTDDKGVSDDYIRTNYITVLPGWEAGGVASSAWNGLVGFGHFLASFLIGLGIWSPLWIVILVILYFAWWRRRKRKS